MVLAIGLSGVPAHAQLASGAQSAPAAISSPTQVAYLQARVKEARQVFAGKAAAVSGVAAEKVLLGLPVDWRAADPRYAIIPYLEKARRAPLAPAQRQEIEAADQELKSAIAKARAEALKH